MQLPLYYLPGMGGRLATGLGAALIEKGLEVTGRELIGEFRALDFQDQVKTVVDDLQTHFWSEDARVIANSFGAYIFLHAQLAMPVFPGKVLLLSPIVGEFENEKTMMNFIPPRAETLFKAASQGLFPSLPRCEIHTGQEDWQANPSSVSIFASLIGVLLNIVPDAGHSLPRDYVQNALEQWI